MMPPMMKKKYPVIEELLRKIGMTKTVAGIIWVLRRPIANRLLPGHPCLLKAYAPMMMNISAKSAVPNETTTEFFSQVIMGCSAMISW